VPPISREVPQPRALRRRAHPQNRRRFRGTSTERSRGPARMSRGAGAIKRRSRGHPEQRERSSHESKRSVTRETSLKDVARTLVELGISGMPVVDDDGSVIGVISEADVLAKGPARVRGRRCPRAADASRGSRGEGEARRARRGEAMTSPAIIVEPYWTISVGCAVDARSFRQPAAGGPGRAPRRDRHARRPHPRVRALGRGDRARGPRDRRAPGGDVL
jgi:hypothetical protein